MEKISEELKLIPSMREDYYVDIGWLNDQRTKLKSQYEKINEIHLRNQNGRIANEKILPEMIQLKESFFSLFLMAQEINDHHSQPTIDVIGEIAHFPSSHFERFNKNK
ncbi:hypothetical protein SNEBB_000197 [Seison nebaliae]|nr:hypothetical protein SNEBB_000197 [Seison nebaliae]